MGKISVLKEFLTNNGRKLDELLWSHVYHDAINGIEWVNKEPLSLYPGRWAVGYNWLYVAIRILNDYKPSNVLEFGLGQSSVLINQYFKNNENWSNGGAKRHLVIEQDELWGKIFTETYSLSDSFQLGICSIDRDEKNSFYNKKQLEDYIAKDRFEFISIDGPNDGGVIKDGSARSDILDFLPEILDNDFCIVFDDYNNPRKIPTGKQVEKKLSDNGIKFQSAIYRGQTDIKLIASESLKYMTTL